jgi:hypothetical protein
MIRCMTAFVSFWIVLACVNDSSLAGSDARRSPTINIASVTYRRAAGSVDLRVRLCMSNGPGAVISIAEQRRLRGVRVGSDRSVDPTGVDLTRVYPYSCVAVYQIAWVLKPRLVGPGTYTATVRVRDGYGAWSAAVSFSISSP